MKITELNGQFAKLSPASITVKDKDGKTIGVITRAYPLTDRECSTYWSRTRKAVGLDATRCLREMRMIDGEPVYLVNINKNDKCAEKLREAGFRVALYKA